MKNIKKLIILFILFSIQLVYGQKTILPLHVGDIINNLKIKNIIDFEDSTVSLESFKDSLLILDFMHSGCPSCVEKIKEYNNYPDNLLGKTCLLLITSPYDKGFNNIMNKFSINRRKIRYVYSSSFLDNAFPHQTISHLIWIRNKKIIAITGEDAMIPKNINDAKFQNDFSLPVKDDLAKKDYSRIPITKFRLDSLHQVVRPFISNAFSYGGSEESLNNSGVIRLFFINRSILDLYKQCLGINDIPDKLIFSDGINKNQLFFIPNDSSYYSKWEISNTYCYEGIFPKSSTSQQRLNTMCETLENYFHLNCWRDTNLTLCAHLNDLPQKMQNTIDPFINIPKKLIDNVRYGEVEFSLNEIANYFNASEYDTIPFSCDIIKYRKIVKIHPEDIRDFKVLRDCLKNQGVNIKFQYEMRSIIRIKKL